MGTEAFGWKLFSFSQWMSHVLTWKPAVAFCDCQIKSNHITAWHKALLGGYPPHHQSPLSSLLPLHSCTATSSQRKLFFLWRHHAVAHTSPCPCSSLCLENPSHGQTLLFPNTLRQSRLFPVSLAITSKGDSPHAVHLYSWSFHTRSWQAARAEAPTKDHTMLHTLTMCYSWGASPLLHSHFPPCPSCSSPTFQTGSHRALSLLLALSRGSPSQAIHRIDSLVSEAFSELPIKLLPLLLPQYPLFSLHIFSLKCFSTSDSPYVSYIFKCSFSWMNEWVNLYSPSSSHWQPSPQDSVPGHGVIWSSPPSRKS